ncbi:MAG: sulfate transporter CysZ [Gammaproteobacteria bacterium]|nr:MAG: sulfate transporter CysZ [Gammaproteobacteria bacterium]
MRNNPVSGAVYFVRGVRLIFAPGIRAYVIVPVLVNVLVFSALIYFGTGEFRELLDWLLPDWLDWLAIVLLPLFVITALVIVFFAFALIGNLLAAPFNGLLAEAVECHITGTPIPGGGLTKMMLDLGRTIVSELRKLAYIVLRGIPVLLLFVIPGLNLAAPFIWILFGAWMLAISYVDYPMGNHGLSFPEQRRQLGRHRYLALGFGAAVMFALAIPVVNFLVIPAAVAGATILWVERLDGVEVGPEGGQI